MVNGHKHKLLEKIVQDSDQHSFRLVYDDLSPKIYAFCRSYHLPREEAEEVVQEVFIRFWERRREFRLELPLENYLITIAKNLMLKKLRHHSVQAAYANARLKQEPISFNLEDELIYQDFHQQARKIIDQLSPMRRQIFLEVQDRETTCEEIAEKTGLSVRTVETHLYQAKKQLRKKFSFLFTLAWIFYLA